MIYIKRAYTIPEPRITILIYKDILMYACQYPYVGPVYSTPAYIELIYYLVITILGYKDMFMYAYPE